jgi:hypothetical protein
MRKFILLASTLIVAVNSFGRERTRYSELGFMIGCSYYLGDLGPGGHFNSLTQPGGGLVYRYNFNRRFDVRATALFGTLKADDAISNDPAEQFRNLNFKSDVIELAGVIEFNFLPYEIGDSKTPFTPYVFLGVAGFHHSPLGLYQKNWIGLRDLGTEGQGSSLSSSKRYSLFQISVPFGVGIKINVGKSVGLSLDWGMRKTFTDYLDDVSKTYVDPVLLAADNGGVAGVMSDRSLNPDPTSNVGKQRGNATNKDWYAFAGVMLTFRLNAKPHKCASYN